MRQLGEPVADGPDQQVGVQAAEDPLDVLQGLGGLHCAAGAEHAGGQTGADHVDPVQGRLIGDLLLVPLPGQALIVDVHGEVLGDLLLVDHFAHREDDQPLAG